MITHFLASFAASMCGSACVWGIWMMQGKKMRLGSSIGAALLIALVLASVSTGLFFKLEVTP